jgi:hypothetical protein
MDERRAVRGSVRRIGSARSASIRAVRLVEQMLGLWRGQNPHVNGELAVLVALCLHGNEWLASGGEHPPGVEAENSTFKYVKHLRVTCPQRALFRTNMWESEGAAPWLQFLRKSDSRRLSLVTAGDPQPSDLPDEIAASFANGGRWALVSDGPTPRIWYARWSVEHQDDPDQRIWAVQLIGHPLRQSVRAASPHGAARSDLQHALGAIRDFATTADLQSWATWFDQALAQFEDPEPTIPYNPDLAPTTLPLKSRQLLAAAIQAWVFGGMGSWNDVWLADETLHPTYTALTGQLYSAVLAAITEVTNTQT